ncbi:dephospho-CoA kinase [Peptococcaceae bacterium]|nr:dephospho-CoA kinase [Peptococcaceae bacterium]
MFETVRMIKMPIIGLTGGIGSGKTKVANYLLQLGAAILDADLIARDIVLPGSIALQEITAVFGAAILHSNGTLNRAKLATLVFNDPVALQKLNAITHPKITEVISNKITEYTQKTNQQHHQQVLILVAPLLIETKLHLLVDQVWVIHVDHQTQLQRVMQRDQLTATLTLKRIRSQLPEQERLKYADEIIDNSGSWENTKEQLLQLWAKYTSE